jgi:hypothetical protein
MKHAFTLTYELSADDCNPDELVERLGASGCTDALIGLGQPGRIALEFVREAESAQAAMFSAIEDVRRAIPSAALIEEVHPGEKMRVKHLLELLQQQDPEAVVVLGDWM